MSMYSIEGDYQLGEQKLKLKLHRAESFAWVSLSPDWIIIKVFWDANQYQDEELLKIAARAYLSGPPYKPEEYETNRNA